MADSHIGDRVVLATWPNYDAANFDMFTDQTGAFTQINVFGSNEEMLANNCKWAEFGTFSYPRTITTYVEELIEPLDISKLPNYDAVHSDPCFADAGTVDGVLYARKLGHNRRSHWRQ